MDRDNEALFEFAFNSGFDEDHHSAQKVRHDEYSRSNFFRDLEIFVVNESFSNLAEALLDNDAEHYDSRKENLCTLVQLLDFGATLSQNDYRETLNNSDYRWFFRNIYPSVMQKKLGVIGPYPENLRSLIDEITNLGWLSSHYAEDSKAFFHEFQPNTAAIAPEPQALWQSQEDTVMTTITSAVVTKSQKAQAVVSEQAQIHVSAATTAAKLELGRGAILLIKDQIRPNMPAMLAVMLDTPVGDLAIASGCSVLATIVSDDPRAKIVGEAMLTVAYGELLQKLKLPEMMSGVISKLPTNLFAAIEKAEAKAAD